MRHRMKRGKLGRTTSHKEAMLSNLLVSLIKSGAVETTESKAKNSNRFLKELYLKQSKEPMQQLFKLCAGLMIRMLLRPFKEV